MRKHSHPVSQAYPAAEHLVHLLAPVSTCSPVTWSTTPHLNSSSQIRPTSTPTSTCLDQIQIPCVTLTANKHVAFGCWIAQHGGNVQPLPTQSSELLHRRLKDSTIDGAGHSSSAPYGSLLQMRLFLATVNLSSTGCKIDEMETLAFMDVFFHGSACLLWVTVEPAALPILATFTSILHVSGRTCALLSHHTRKRKVESGQRCSYPTFYETFPSPVQYIDRIDCSTL
ncbi:uncharacterized protein LY89DRAFT_713127 [Mollisia scopiformis]|uniref:Uncharacterized protein n=1 Tax=Mollisia scopiformis TaxID=149040 RepID=A0A194XVR7_MOLSC|nr:uncharacterized protein LY89DRAFT_713127 [Mollisia scopiformis]KUJ24236.1 hypothetical protein LY89DRAFT_713127 [Mollisia scopiformis]